MTKKTKKNVDKTTKETDFTQTEIKKDSEEIVKNDNNNNKNEHLVLARKYRPRLLSELIGQEIFVKTISNAININKLHHAFLLTGTRGVGKTSSARILALSLNCKKYEKPTTTPCLECDCCQMILNGSNPDVIEFDAASNTGKDEIHENVIDNIDFAPMISRYKIYIIDEVHMLSKSAFNALLKTLEEPPEKVKFIFATTEINKVPITILSRCQKFYLKNIPEDILLSHLKNICEKENISFEEDGLRLLAKYANGSVRDSLSLLDQAIAISDNCVKTEDIKNMLAIPDRQIISNLFYNCYLGDVKNAIKDIECFISNDTDCMQIVSEIMNLILDCLKIATNIIESKDIPNEFYDNISKLTSSNNLNVPRLLRMWQILSASLAEMRVIQNQQYLTIMVYKLCYSSNLPTPIEALKLIKNNDLQTAVNTFPNGKIIS